MQGRLITHQRTVLSVFLLITLVALWLNYFIFASYRGHTFSGDDACVPLSVERSNANDGGNVIQARQARSGIKA